MSWLGKIGVVVAHLGEGLAVAAGFESVLFRDDGESEELRRQFEAWSQAVDARFDLLERCAAESGERRLREKLAERLARTEALTRSLSEQVEAFSALASHTDKRALNTAQALKNFEAHRCASPSEPA